MSIAFSIPVVSGRGAGIGNELFVWGKAYVASRILNIRLLHPAWGLNKRRYYRYFGTSRIDWPVNKLIGASLPRYRFNESDYLADKSRDFAQSVLSFSKRHDLNRKKIFVLEFSGLWGGLGIIPEARQYLLGRLLNTRWTQSNLYHLNRLLDRRRLLIGMHIRQGDFQPGGSEMAYEGRFNQAIPLSWYLAVARNLETALPGAVQFLITSDAHESYLAPLLDNFDCISTSSMANTDISDLIALSECDLVVCSISTYSMCATYFSGNPYIWFKPQLTGPLEERRIWSTPTNHFHQDRNGLALEGPPRTLQSRGVAVDWSGIIPPQLIDYLGRKLVLKDRTRDLIYGGSVSNYDI